MDPSIQSTKSALERHHIFPKKFLETIGVSDMRDTNQIANFTMVEWGDNNEIRAKPPSTYVPIFESRFDPDELAKMYYCHALPDGWATLSYHEFLKKRRELMAGVIRDAYRKLAGEPSQPSGVAPAISVAELVQRSEGTTIEFKSTLRINLHTGEKDPKMEQAVLKTIAAFLNMSGGTLIIGVTDDGDPVGIESDKFPDEDKMNLHLVNLIKDRIGVGSMMYITPKFDDYQMARVMVVNCLPSKLPIFVKDGVVERFYIRTGAATSELPASQTQQFIKQRFAA